jgi:hypothetical protein
MGKGARPLYSYWDGEHLGYIDARKRIYAPLYARAVYENPAWQQLLEVHDAAQKLYLRDYDGYNHKALGMTLSEVLNYPDKIMGHSFVLAMMLEQDEALKELVGFKL